MKVTLHSHHTSSLLLSSELRSTHWPDNIYDTSDLRWIQNRRYPFPLSSTELVQTPPGNKIPGYATGYTKKFLRHNRRLQQEATRPTTAHCHMTLYTALTLSHDTVHCTHTDTSHCTLPSTLIWHCTLHSHCHITLYTALTLSHHTVHCTHTVTSHCTLHSHCKLHRQFICSHKVPQTLGVCLVIFC
jgi:hypothetical protein